MEVAIISYGMGNLRSVANAFAALNCEAQIVVRPEQLSSAKKIVLPGVGAFGDGMRNLSEGGWIQRLNEEVIQKGKPFLGICLGMQLLATTGLEHGTHEGLGWVSGISQRLPTNDPSVRVPHIGWNDVRLKTKNGLFNDLDQQQTFYFVHSYVLAPDNQDLVTGVCSHGIDFAASLQSENIFATQFHPEKSHRAGLAVLKNFARQSH
jgi:imidazole glycerol-phosphate synthase subunit HisH